MAIGEIGGGEIAVAFSVAFLRFGIVRGVDKVDGWIWYVLAIFVLIF